MNSRACFKCHNSVFSQNCLICVNNHLTCEKCLLTNVKCPVCEGDIHLAEVVQNIDYRSNFEPLNYAQNPTIEEYSNSNYHFDPENVNSFHMNSNINYLEGQINEAGRFTYEEYEFRQKYPGQSNQYYNESQSYYYQMESENVQLPFLNEEEKWLYEKSKQYNLDEIPPITVLRGNVQKIDEAEENNTDAKENEIRTLFSKSDRKEELNELSNNRKQVDKKPMCDRLKENLKKDTVIRNQLRNQIKEQFYYNTLNDNESNENAKREGGVFMVIGGSSLIESKLAARINTQAQTFSNYTQIKSKIDKVMKSVSDNYTEVNKRKQKRRELIEQQKNDIRNQIIQKIQNGTITSETNVNKTFGTRDLPSNDSVVEKEIKTTKFLKSESKKVICNNPKLKDCLNPDFVNFDSSVATDLKLKIKLSENKNNQIFNESEEIEETSENSNLKDSKNLSEQATVIITENVINTDNTDNSENNKTPYCASVSLPSQFCMESESVQGCESLIADSFFNCDKITNKKITDLELGLRLPVTEVNYHTGIEMPKFIQPNIENEYGDNFNLEFEKFINKILMNNPKVTVKDIQDALEKISDVMKQAEIMSMNNEIYLDNDDILKEPNNLSPESSLSDILLNPGNVWRAYYRPLKNDFSEPLPQLEMVISYGEVKELDSLKKKGSASKLNIKRTPLDCPIPNCIQKVCISEFVKHVKLNHIKIPIETISPSVCRNLLLDTKLIYYGLNTCQILYLVGDKLTGLGSQEFKDYLPVLLMTTKISVLELICPNNNFGKTNGQNQTLYLIWLTGLVATNLPVYYTLVAWTKKHLKCHIVSSGKMYSFRESQNPQTIYESGQALVLTQEQCNKLTDNGRNMLELQIIVR